MLNKKYIIIAILFSIRILCFSELRVYYINVGQGDCIYISFPDKQNMLIDGGPESATDETLNPVINFLKRKNIKKINYMLLSHPHTDHINGLYAVLKSEVKVEKIYDTGVNNTGTTIDDEFRTIAKSTPGRYIIVSSTGPLQGFSVFSVTCTVLYTNTSPQNDLNNNSIVIKIQYSSSTFLFGGDVTSSVETQLVTMHSNTLRSDCYKVHHHGSKWSSSEQFLNFLQPKYAFIQTNGWSYGHPTPEAMDRINIYTQMVSEDEKKITQNITNRYGKYGPYTNIYSNHQNGTIFVYTTGDGKYKIGTHYSPVPDEEEKIPTDEDYTKVPTTPSPITVVEIKNNIFNPEQDEKPFLSYYNLYEEGKIYIKIYTLFGELVDEEEFYEYRKYVNATGDSNWRWDGKNSYGELVAPGVYIFHIQTPVKTEIKKVVVIR